MPSPPEPEDRFAGKPLPASRFAGDAGTADAAVRRALADYVEGRAGPDAVQRALLGTRLLIPTAAGLDRASTDPLTGRRTDAESHLAVVDLVSEAGWRGLLAFTGIDSVADWDPAARPVPTTAEEAARSAREDGRSVLVLDVSGPYRAALTGWPLLALSAGIEAFATHEDPDVITAISAAALEHPAVDGLKILPAPTPGLPAAASSGGEAGPEAVVVLRLVAQPPRSAGEVVEEVARALRADPLLVQRCPGGLSLAIQGPPT